MKNLFTMAVIIMLGAAVCLAGDEGSVKAKASGTAAHCARAHALQTSSQQPAPETKAENPHAACAAKSETLSTTATQATPSEAGVRAEPATEPTSAQMENAKALTAAHAGAQCPDVSSKEALNAFHESLHPMHMALGEGKYDEIRSLYSKLELASAGVAAYKCPMGDKCPPECRKEFEARKANLLKSVEVLGAACKGDDNKKVEETFNVMHEAYIKFASTCGEKETAK